MSIEHILIGKHHGGSDCWRTPPLLFRNLHQELVKYLPPAGHNGLVIRSPFASAIVIFKSEPRRHEITQMICCADTLLPLTIINRGGLRGRPTIYPPETLDNFIKLYRQGKTIKYIADALRMPLSTSYRIAQRLS